MGHLLTELGSRTRGYPAGLEFDLPTPRIDWSVLDWNESAIRSYESLGAVPMDEWTGYQLSDGALAALGPPDLQVE